MLFTYKQYANQHGFHGSGQATTGRKHTIKNFNWHGRKLKISKILNFQNSNLKTCNMLTKYSQFQV